MTPIISTFDYSRVDRFQSQVRIARSCRHIENVAVKGPVTVQVMELLPLHYFLLLHTYRYQISSTTHEPNSTESQNLVIESCDYKYHTGNHRTPGSLVWNISLSCDSQIVIQYTALKRFLHRERFEPDVSRGLAINPTIISYSYQNISKLLSITSSDIVTIPYPDASMPFNVITLVRIFIYFLICEYLLISLVDYSVVR